MKSKKDVWIEEALGSLNGIERAKADSAIYQKIMSRVSEVRGISNIVPQSTVWRIAAALFVVVALNAFTCIMVSQTSQGTKNEELKAFASEYGISSNSLNY